MQSTLRKKSVLTGGMVFGMALAFAVWADPCQNCDNKTPPESTHPCAEGNNVHTCASQTSQTVCESSPNVQIFYEVKDDFPNGTCPAHDCTNCNEHLRACKRTVLCEWDDIFEVCDIVDGSGDNHVWDEASKKEEEACPKG